MSTVSKGMARRSLLRRLASAGLMLTFGRVVVDLIAKGNERYRRYEDTAHAASPVTRGAVCGGEACLSTLELSVLEALTEVIIPPDRAGPGAREAGVARQIQDSLSMSPGVLQRYREGLQAFEEMARQRYGVGFAAASPDQQRELFAYVEEVKGKLWREAAPVALLERAVWKFSHLYYRHIVGITDPPMILVEQLVRDAAEAFYSTAAAWNSLGYAGPPFPFGYIGQRPTCLRSS